MRELSTINPENDGNVTYSFLAMHYATQQEKRITVISNSPTTAIQEAHRQLHAIGWGNYTLIIM